MVSIWFPLIYNAHHVSHLLSFHFTFLLPCRTQHSGGRSPWAVFRPRAISDHGCRRGGGSIDGYLQIDWYIWYMTYVYIYIYMHSIYCYMGVWELYRSQLHICRERERKSENLVVSVCGMFTHQYAIWWRYAVHVCTSLLKPMSAPFSSFSSCPWLKRRKNWRGSPKAQGHVLGMEVAQWFVLNLALCLFFHQGIHIIISDNMNRYKL